MKYLLIVLLVFSGTIGFSKNIVTEGKEWRYAVGSNFPEFKVRTYHCLFLRGDTTINDLTYTALRKDEGCNGQSISLIGFMRDYEKKTFFLEKNGSEEFLLYDFGVAVGDTLTVGLYSDHKLKVDSVFVNEKNEKTLFLSSSVIQHTWVEGIGSTDELLMQQVVGGFNIFTCCKLNGEIIYLNPPYNSCDITTSVKETLSSTALIKIVPLGGGLLQINTESGKSGTLSIFDINGKKLFDNMQVNGSTQVQTPYVGAYIYCYTSDKGQTQTGKVMVR
jgi:hypothetical protein